MGEVALVLGWAGVLGCVLLSGPVAAFLFAPDARELAPPVRDVIEGPRLGAGLLGIAGLAVALYRPRVARRLLPISRGAAALPLLAAAAAGLVGEGALRVRGFRHWGSLLRTPLPLSTLQRSGSTNLRPGVYATGVRDDFRPGARRTIFVTINRYGLRGPAPALPKPTGRTRIVCLGGSTTFGYSVTDGEEWPARLQAALTRERPVEVLNAGRPGSTAWSDFAYCRDRLLRLQPDIVVVYEGFNDFWRGVLRRGGGHRDYGVVNEDLPPSSESLDFGPARAWPLRASFAAHHLGAWFETRLVSAAMLRAAGSAARGAGGFEYAPEIVSMYEHNLAAIVRLCRRAGVRVVLATVAGCDDPGLPPADRQARVQYVLDQMPVLDVADAERGLDLYREVTRRVASAQGAPLVDLARQMPKDTAFFADTVHFTPLGEERMATLLATALESSVLPTP